MIKVHMLAAAIGIIFACGQGFAVTFEVNDWREMSAVNLGDGTALTEEGTVTLRSALQESNIQPGADIIEFVGASDSPLMVYSTLRISDDLTIRNGSQSVALHIRAFGDTPFRFFQVDEDVRFALEGASIQLGERGARIQAERGALMYVAPGATIFLAGCRLFDGVASSYGGGIYLDHATAILHGVSLHAFAGIDGGGLYNNEGTVVITRSVGGGSAAQRNGGLFYNRGGTVTISGGLGSGDAGEFGGSLYSDGGTVNVDWALFVGAGVAATGGGIFLTNGSSVRMSRTNVRGNQATESGAGLYIESGSVVATQCSFADNTAGGPGGGVYIAEGNSASFINCTLTANSAELGGGLYVAPGASATIGNTILAGNAGQGEFADLWGGVTSLGHNLLGIAPPGMTAFLQGALGAPLDPMLSFHELYPNTGRIINLHLLETGSPAIDMGDNNLLAHPDFIGSVCKDAADVPRVRNGVIDIGAVEFQAGTEQEPCAGHSADPRDTGIINLSNLLRMIQLFNSDGFHCDADTEDGYTPGTGDQSCSPHSSDYFPQDWRINLTELLRVIQFFNVGGYYPCPDTGTEDGFCPGVQ